MKIDLHRIQQKRRIMQKEKVISKGYSHLEKMKTKKQKANSYSGTTTPTAPIEKNETSECRSMQKKIEKKSWMCMCFLKRCRAGQEEREKMKVADKEVCNEMRK